MNLSNKQWKLIQRYITGRVTTEERLEIERWMDKDPMNKNRVRELEEIWSLSPEEDFDVDVQGAWDQFKARQKGGSATQQGSSVRRQEGGAHQQGNKAKRQEDTAHSKPGSAQKKDDSSIQEGSVHQKGNAHQKKWFQPKMMDLSTTDSGWTLQVFRAAAIILVAFFTGYFVHHINSTTESIQVEQRQGSLVMQEFSADRGEKAQVTLSDGTEVMLNASSSLRYPEEFDGSNREVYLEGEAFFQVIPEADRMFIVHAQNADIEVLGTEFNIRGWREDPGVDITVLSGKVSVSSSEPGVEDTSEVILEAGYYTQVLKGEGPEEVQKVDPVHQMLWTSGGIHFNNMPFERVIRDIERRFDVNITVSDDALLNVPYTGTFQFAELDEIMTVISVTMGVEYRRDGSRIELLGS